MKHNVYAVDFRVCWIYYKIGKGFIYRYMLKYYKHTCLSLAL